MTEEHQKIMKQSCGLVYEHIKVFDTYYDDKMEVAKVKYVVNEIYAMICNSEQKITDHYPTDEEIETFVKSILNNIDVSYIVRELRTDE